MEDALNMYNDTLKQAKKREVVTVIEPRGEFYYAEEYHQQYLIKNPYGYCNHGFNGVSCNL
jgi:peptide-methionine (S)-S-oxide reductase